MGAGSLRAREAAGGRECPPRALRPRSGRRAACSPAGRAWRVRGRGRHFLSPPRRPGSLSPCRRSRCLGLGRPGGARQGLCKFERLRDVTSRPGMSRPFGPGLGAFAALAPVPVEGEQGRRRATRAGRPDYPGHQVGRPDQPLWQDPWSSAVNVPLGLAVLPRSPHISGVAFVRFNTVVQCLELRFLYPLPPSSASFLQCGQWEVLLVPDYGARKCSLS